MYGILPASPFRGIDSPRLVCISVDCGAVQTFSELGSSWSRTSPTSRTSRDRSPLDLEVCRTCVVRPRSFASRTSRTSRPKAFTGGRLGLFKRERNCQVLRGLFNRDLDRKLISARDRERLKRDLDRRSKSARDRGKLKNDREYSILLASARTLHPPALLFSARSRLLDASYSPFLRPRLLERAFLKSPKLRSEMSSRFRVREREFPISRNPSSICGVTDSKLRPRDRDRDCDCGPLERWPRARDRHRSLRKSLIFSSKVPAKAGKLGDGQECPPRTTSQVSSRPYYVTLPGKKSTTKGRVPGLLLSLRC